jgi:hypothetical protein
MEDDETNSVMITGNDWNLNIIIIYSKLSFMKLAGEWGGSRFFQWFIRKKRK